MYITVSLIFLVDSIEALNYYYTPNPNSLGVVKFFEYCFYLSGLCVTYAMSMVKSNRMLLAVAAFVLALISDRYQVGQCQTAHHYRQLAVEVRPSVEQWDIGEGESSTTGNATTTDSTSSSVPSAVGGHDPAEETDGIEPDGRAACSFLPGLTERQRLWCRDNYVFLEPIASGAQIALAQCRKQFADRRWNCPTDNPAVFSKIYDKGSQETAFVHSIQSAGATLAIARTCSRGHAPRWCGCDTTWTRNEAVNWTWGSCSDNYVKGYELSKQFLDAGETDTSTPKSKSTLWNNEAGRLAVRRLMRLQCKCHGLTGTCAHQTCWYSLPLVRVVGNLLMAKYESSTAVKMSSSGSPRLVVKRTTATALPLTTEDLVYLRRSPDYCLSDPAAGSLGTFGRTCKGKKSGYGGCDHLCCNRGFNVQRYAEKEKCKCKFVWCCHVRCRTCLENKERHTCN
ncbi:protein Wnt-4-like [Sycon ciliatum]